MFRWWPKVVPEEVIVPLRSFGRKNLRMGEVKVRRTQLVGGTVEDQEWADNLVFRPIRWDGELTLAEKRTEVVNPILRFCLARILADGPKLLTIPSGMEGSLNQVEITLPVEDFFPPFPSCIVERENGEYHLVVFDNHSLTVVVPSVGGEGVTDSFCMYRPDQLIEDYLKNHRWTEDVDLGQAGHLAAIRHDNDALWENHRLRATLNFLLLATMQGTLSQGRIAKPRQVRNRPPAKLTNPEIFVPQNIELFKQRSISATTPDPDHPGSPKRPHFRRAHWRRVAVGPGRTGRTLKLIRCSFVNRHRLIDDPGDNLTYSAKPKPR
jgi:hypothetical protein